jgi:hypothetical protein
MVSYAEYPSTMPSNDFDLYPTQEQYADLLVSSQTSYLPTSQYMDNSFSGAFENNTQQTLSVPRTQDFRFSLDASQLKQSYAYSPAASPAHSNSFDVIPPQLSTSSESSASVQSTSSSAIGSPSMDPQYQEQWTIGLGLGPDMMQKDNFGQDSFTSSGFEYEISLVV